MRLKIWMPEESVKHQTNWKKMRRCLPWWFFSVIFCPRRIHTCWSLTSRDSDPAHWSGVGGGHILKKLPNDSDKTPIYFVEDRTFVTNPDSFGGLFCWSTMISFRSSDAELPSYYWWTRSLKSNTCVPQKPGCTQFRTQQEKRTKGLLAKHAPFLWGLVSSILPKIFSRCSIKFFRSIEG